MKNDFVKFLTAEIEKQEIWVTQIYIQRVYVQAFDGAQNG